MSGKIKVSGFMILAVFLTLPLACGRKEKPCHSCPQPPGPPTVLSTTPTFTRTATPTSTSTGITPTPSSTRTFTPTHTPTFTPSFTPTGVTLTPTRTPTPTFGSATPTPTSPCCSPTATPTPTSTGITPTPSSTRTSTPTSTIDTPTATFTPTFTPSFTPTGVTLTPTPTFPCCSPTATPTPTSTGITPTPSSTPTSTHTPTRTPTPPGCFMTNMGNFTSTGTAVIFPGQTWAEYSQPGYYGQTQRIVVNFPAAGATARVGVYSDTGATYPNLLVTSSGYQAVVAGLNTFDIGTVSIVAGSRYWLALELDGASIPVTMGFGGGNSHVVANASMPDPFTAAQPVSGGRILMYAEVCMVFTPSPTATATGTFTPTRTPTPTFGSATPTLTPTSTFTPTPTAYGFSCVATPGVFGDQVDSGSDISPVSSSSTRAQEYSVSMNTTVKRIWVNLSAPATVRVGIYADGPSNWPGIRLYVSAPQVLPAGLQGITVPDVVLTPGNYWLAYGFSGAPTVPLAAASGSTALAATVALNFPGNWLDCGIPTPTPTIVCTPPPGGTATNQVLIYADVCYPF